MQKSTSFNLFNLYNGILIVVKMALKSLKRSKTESLNQSSEIEAISGLFPSAASKREFTDARSGLSAMRYTTPSTNRDELASLSEAEREEYEERVAIMEYDGGLSREEAERQALEIIKERGNGK